MELRSAKRLKSFKPPPTAAQRKPRFKKCVAHERPTIGRQIMGLTASWKTLATVLAFGFVAAMVLGIV